MLTCTSFSLQSDHRLIQICQSFFGVTTTSVSAIDRRTADRAFAELLSRYHQWLWKQIHKLPGLDESEAYSAALEGFRRAIITFDLSSGYALVTWASHCVRSALTAVFAREQRQAAKVERVAAIAPLVHEDELIDPFEMEQLHRDLQHLQIAITQLSTATQAIITMRTTGMSFVQISQELGKSASAVRMSYNRALKSLQRLLSLPSSAQFGFGVDTDSSCRDFSSRRLSEGVRLENEPAIWSRSLATGTEPCIYDPPEGSIALCTG
uniref:RNA polymerase, sigma-24 subunit, ECF subfamily n=1 Tax=Cyanothece sp. (strain PCC 7425 / ATCC 29141) TaxID=395961 RepID=B8HZ29_CYAP4